ncbi:MAG: NAD(P)-binding domain-containing protein [Candidatus Amulumruptor caecigallinarius]|nr:NAD(P)-binding domain-containing protein [Candidatus Amulumruptor caecigallinarius]MCM1397762.1 NAD(P)-binding domain-containing protein [Candidatus Amulumruptor caecigallinarius]MCM1454502.1 NAD(P)-binding domain-containing protein [bacterium]
MKISIIGAGAMGGAIAEGLLAHGMTGNDVMVSDPSAAVVERFAAMGAQATADNAQCAQWGDVVMVVVKPWLVERVAAGIVDTLDYGRQTLVVIAAGVSSEALHGMFDKSGQSAPIVMVIPNIAVSIGESMTFVVNAGASAEGLAKVTGIFDRLGSTLITEERLLGAGTTLASCGIAYAMRYIRAAVEGGVELGFKAAEAQKIVVQTVKGAAGLLSQPGAHPESEIDKVTTPGGVTIRGLNEMEHAGFTSAVIRGLKAGLKA